MLRQHREYRVLALRVIDVILVGFMLWFAHLFRHSILPALPNGHLLPTIDPFTEFAWQWVIILLAAPLLLEANGFYRVSWSSKLWPAARSMLGIMLLLALTLTLRRLVLSRMVLILFTVFSTAALIARVHLHRWQQRRKASRPGGREPILIAAAGARSSELARRIRSEPDGSLADIHEFDLAVAGLPEFAAALHERSIQRVIVSGEGIPYDRLAQLIRACEIEGIEVWLLADFYKTSVAKASFDDLLGTPTLVVRSTPAASWQLLCKAVIDRAGALALLILGAPLFAAIAVAIRLTSPGPVLFRQRRSGLHGRPFTMLKFRSMVSDAEMQKAELEPFNQMSGPVFKLSTDPRVTPLGRLLRRTSLDELPQLWNVLRGEMSLVGPRPLPVYETENFADLAHRRRLSMKPGLTCLWQISGRNAVTNFEDWVRLDLEYIDNWSLWLDIGILLRTIPIVLTGKGAG
ncbi:MAG: sugar transferase [Verrucomicrobiae bacterium]|nr:sugar transferase [Verrucomicrobiae bacterium]